MSEQDPTKATTLISYSSPYDFFSPDELDAFAQHYRAYGNAAFSTQLSDEGRLEGRFVSLAHAADPDSWVYSRFVEQPDPERTKIETPDYMGRAHKWSFEAHLIQWEDIAMTAHFKRNSEPYFGPFMWLAQLMNDLADRTRRMGTGLCTVMLAEHAANSESPIWDFGTVPRSPKEQTRYGQIARHY